MDGPSYAPDRTAAPSRPGSPRKGAEEYVAALATPGPDSAAGCFTMDPHRARELLRDFQLSDPSAYALLLVQAAVLRGAERLTVTSTRSALTLAFDGAPFTPGELDDRYARMLGEPTTVEDASLRRLGLALHSLLAFDPQARVSLQSGDGLSGASLECGAGHEDDRSRATSPVKGTSITIHRRAGKVQRDESQITSRCRHASIDVTVNGRRVTGPPREPEAFEALRFAGPGGPCLAVVEPLGPTTAELRVVQHGVVIQTLPRSAWPPNLRVVARADGFATDLTGFVLREGPEQQALLDACDGAVRGRLDACALEDNVELIARQEAEQRLARLWRLRSPVVAGSVLLSVLFVVVLLVMMVMGVRYPGMPQYALFAIPLAVVGFPLITVFLWDDLRIRPLAHVLLPPGTAVRAAARALTAEDDRARKILGL